VGMLEPFTKKKRAAASQNSCDEIQIVSAAETSLVGFVMQSKQAWPHPSALLTASIKG
jgi:hypothetical protein